MKFIQDEAKQVHEKGNREEWKVKFILEGKGEGKKNEKKEIFECRTFSCYAEKYLWAGPT